MKLVSVETPEKSVCKMTFSASAEELEAASNAVYERTRATYTIKGFAKGEADRAQIEADRGEHTFWYDAINDLMDKDVPALYDAAMAEHGFHAVDEPVYDLVSVKKDEGFVATATTALQPELSLTQTTGFKTECVTPEVTDKEIDAVLERRRAMAAELVPHKGPAVKGNIVHIDYEGLLEGKPFNGGTAQNQTLQLGSGRMIPGFEEGILGHKGGEAFDIFVTFPARYHVKDLAGKPVVFKIKLHDVCVRQLPALNSDFAKKAANVDTIKRSSNNVIDFMESEGYFRFKADYSISSKEFYDIYKQWCEDNACHSVSAIRFSAELRQNDRRYNLEATNNIYLPGGRRVRGFVGIEPLVHPCP